MTQSTRSRPSGTSCSSAASGPSPRPQMSSRCTRRRPANWSARFRWRRGRRRRRLRGRAQGLRRGPVATHVAARAGRRARRRGQADGGARRRAEVPAGRRDGSAADDRRHDAVRRGDGGVPVLRRRGRQVHLARLPRRCLRRDDGAARADRRRRPPSPRGTCRSSWPPTSSGPPLVAGCTDRGQAGRRDPAVALRDGRDLRRGRPARGRAVHRARRPRDRPRADRQPRDRQVHVHRVAARSARRSARSRPRSSSRARSSWAASRRRSSSRTPTWIPRCRCCCSPG